MKKLRAFAGWALFATVLAGAFVPHSHPLVADSDESGLSDGHSQRVITDDSSTKLRWHSVLRIENDDCFACHAQRTSDLSRPVGVRTVSVPQSPFVSTRAAETFSVVRSSTAPRAPPTLL